MTDIWLIFRYTIIYKLIFSLKQEIHFWVNRLLFTIELFNLYLVYGCENIKS